MGGFQRLLGHTQMLECAGDQQRNQGDEEMRDRGGRTHLDSADDLLLRRSVEGISARHHTRPGVSLLSRAQERVG